MKRKITTRLMGKVSERPQFLFDRENNFVNQRSIMLERKFNFQICKYLKMFSGAYFILQLVKQGRLSKGFLILYIKKEFLTLYNKKVNIFNCSGLGCKYIN